ncbi:MAG: hypothetical protein K2X55_02205 [Burkholderiaceae bacterium]|nr:hypothetical protein [Burkholderiaceae bacterium]
MKQLKAYEVYDGGDNWAIIFATNSATARREGASECGCEFHEVDHCRRKPELDRYAPGPVPPQALIDAGWGFECRRHGCSNWARADDDYVIRGDFVYCCSTCHAMDCARLRQNEAAQAAMCDLVLAWLPDAQITDVYVFGSNLEPQERGGGYSAYADLRFPDIERPARWVFGEAGPRVHGDDIPAFSARYPAFKFEGAAS